MEIPTGVHCNHRMVSALSFICMCVFAIVRVLVFVLAYTARNTLILDAIIYSFKLVPCIVKKLSLTYLYLKRQQLLLAMEQNNGTKLEA